MKRIVTLYSKGRDARFFAVPRSCVAKTLHDVAHKLRADTNRPFAVDVLVDGKILLPTTETCRRNPALSVPFVLVQNCSTDGFVVPNRAWRLEEPSPKGLISTVHRALSFIIFYRLLTTFY